MNKDYKAKLLEKAGIYIDCCQLLKCVYKLLFSMPKKDRVIIGDKILEYNLSMIAHFSKGFQFKECRLAEIDSFLFDFDRMKALLRMASELKVLLPAKYVLLFDYIERIDEGVAKWRKASTATKSMQSRNQTTSAAMGRNNQEVATDSFNPVPEVSHYHLSVIVGVRHFIMKDTAGLPITQDSSILHISWIQI